MRSVTFPSGLIKMAGNLHLAKDFSKVRSYVAIVCVHPAGGVKEQTAGLYAAKLADEGMVALAYDASYQGESGGEPRQEEDPYARVEDVRAAVDYLTTLGFVDQQRICVLEARRGAGTRLLRGLGVLPHAASAAPKCAEHCFGAQPGSVGRLRRLSSGGTASDPAPPAHRRQQGRIALVQPGRLQARREPRQEPAHCRGRHPHRHVRHTRIRQPGHGPARAALPKRRQGFIGEQVRRAAERARRDERREIGSITSLSKCSSRKSNAKAISTAFFAELLRDRQHA